jgi:hypothetical protein
VSVCENTTDGSELTVANPLDMLREKSDEAVGAIGDMEAESVSGNRCTVYSG